MKKLFSLVLTVVIISSLVLSSFAITTVPVKSIALGATSAALKVGETYTLGVTFTPANTTQKLLTFATTNKNVASVDTKGIITATGEGTATITVGSSNKSVSPVTFEVEVKGRLEETKIYGYLLGSELPGFKDVMVELNKKLKASLNATMEINYIGWGDLNAKYPLILAAGENLDWIYTAAWCQYASQAAKGAFLEMTPELYEKYMPRHWALLKNTTAMKEAAINGKTYMITTSTPDKKIDVTLYREDLRKKYKLPEIKKFSDLEPFLAAVKKNEKGMVPINLDSSYDIGRVQSTLYTETYDSLIDILVSTGSGCGLMYKPFDPDGKLYLPSSDPQLLPVMTRTAKIAKSWYDKGYINKNVFANKIRSKEALVQGKTAVAFGNSIDTQGNISACVKAGMEIGILPATSGRNGKGVANAFTNNGIAISAKSKNWERAMMAMDLVMEVESFDNLVYYGIQGKHYVLKNGKIALPDGIDANNNPYPIDQAGFWFVNKDLFKPQSDWTPGYIKLQNDLKTMLAPDLLAVFTPSTEKIKTEQANCNQVIMQYSNPIAFGGVKNVEAAYKTLDAKLKAAGILKIKTELDKQISTFLASQK